MPHAAELVTVLVSASDVEPSWLRRDVVCDRDVVPRILFALRVRVLLNQRRFLGEELAARGGGVAGNPHAEHVRGPRHETLPQVLHTALGPRDARLARGHVELPAVR